MKKKLKMEGDKFPWFAADYCLGKRPRYSKTLCSDGQVASTSSESAASTSYALTPFQRILIKRSDEKLLQWQEQQIINCIKDNMVNQMVESYMSFGREEQLQQQHTSTASSSRHDEERLREGHLASYRAEQARQSLENSAIMRAIAQYGIAQPLPSHQLFDDNHTEAFSTTSSSSISLSSPPDSPSSHSDWCPFNHLSTTTNRDSNVDDESNEMTSTKTLPSNQSNVVDTIQGTKNDELVANKTHENRNEPRNFDLVPATDDHFDFLEAAVSVAIQEKGLMPYTMAKSPNR